MSKSEQEKYAARMICINGDPKKVSALRIQKQRDSAKRRGVEWTLTYERILDKMASAEYCAISGRKLVFEIGHIDTPSIDRINSNLSYSPRNVQITTAAVNIAKNKLTDAEFIEMCCDVARKNGYVYAG